MYNMVGQLVIGHKWTREFTKCFPSLTNNKLSFFLSTRSNPRAWHTQASISLESHPQHPFVLLFQTGSCHVVPAGLGLTVYSRLDANSQQPSCLSLSNVGISRVSCHSCSSSWFPVFHSQRTGRKAAAKLSVLPPPTCPLDRPAWAVTSMSMKRLPP